MSDIVERLRAAARHPYMDNTCKVRTYDALEAAAEIEKLRAEVSQLEKALFDAYYDSENVVRCWDNDDYIPDDVRINISWTIRTMRHRAVPDEMYERIFPTSRRIEGDGG